MFHSSIHFKSNFINSFHQFISSQPTLTNIIYKYFLYYKHYFTTSTTIPIYLQTQLQQTLTNSILYFTNINTSNNFYYKNIIFNNHHMHHQHQFLCNHNNLHQLHQQQKSFKNQLQQPPQQHHFYVTPTSSSSTTTTIFNEKPPLFLNMGSDMGLKSSSNS